MTSWPSSSKVFRRFIVCALLLNGIWELVQCRFLYTMQGWRAATSALAMAAAVLGDVVAALLVGYIGALIVSKKSAAEAATKMLGVMFVVGGLIGLTMEWAARLAHRWEYTARMPVIQFGTVTVGLVPVLQMALLPAISLALAKRFRAGRPR